MTLEHLNQLTAPEAEAEFRKCCGSLAWANAMAASRPFENEEELFDKADEISSSLTNDDWLEAFRAHPKIGEKKAATAQTQQEQSWSSQEQSAMHSASTDTVSRLARGNQDYEAKFGFIFIVCASGKSPDEMLAILNDRLSNNGQTEFKAAAQEQQKITRLRLEKLLSR
ncbi:MAG TPA: 2-oxo-4-hydroxy-4-carboxy-5-ureidoimidazoline decarboxylase [Pyrinomonadaceae bacterium]|jgi:OHCU decarboxylase|nr:2-oxo-4-hydroxy-4-carboxy-5-ureidoimidazoline decarboxylase [Pyrinomonadaceae bacterium]